MGEGSLGILQGVLEKLWFWRDYCFGGNFGFAGYLEGLKLKRRVWSTVMGSRFGEVGGGVKFETHVLALFVFLSVKTQQCPRF